MPFRLRLLVIVAVWKTCLAIHFSTFAYAEEISAVVVESQPLSMNVKRVLNALEILGAPLPEPIAQQLQAAIVREDASDLQKLLDQNVAVAIHINPESRVKATAGPAKTQIQQSGYTPLIIKIINEAGVTSKLNVSSPQAGALYAGMTEMSMTRQDQLHLLLNQNTNNDSGRFLDLEIFAQQPMTSTLNGLSAEYMVLLVNSTRAGKVEATLEFDVGQGTQDLGFRAEVPILFDAQPAVPVTLSVKDHDGSPTIGSFVFLDSTGHVYPPQPKRLAPDLYFQRQIYRADGEYVLLPPGKMTMIASRGPEYRQVATEINVPSKGESKIEVNLQRWVDPSASGFYSGDHHIHAAGCAHYNCPSEGITPADMFRQIKGEGLNVGCVLTWGPGFLHQQQFFSPTVDKLSDPKTLMKYDVEVSGFGSQALGHVCLLNLREQHYPGSKGGTESGWPTWTTPVLRWAKGHGAVTGYAHSGSGLEINLAAATKRLFDQLDSNRDKLIKLDESANGLLPEPFAKIDSDKDGSLTQAELTLCHDRVATQLPNLAVPELNGVGAQEVFVTTARGLCDFISAMDTPRIAEWNCWYHIMNCGFSLKAAGETDFPCMSGTRVGRGRTYVQLGNVSEIKFSDWVQGLANGQSYVSDGYAHALEFNVEGKHAGDTLELKGPQELHVSASVAFAQEVPLGLGYDANMSLLSGDTVTFHGDKPNEDDRQRGGKRRIELIVNGQVIETQEIVADGKTHDLKFGVSVDRSSWIAIRQFPQLHTNPIIVLVDKQPIRASRSSALWCAQCVRQLWRARASWIAAEERSVADDAFKRAIEVYEQIASETPEGS